ncbi:hypothetical protein [Phenylobacterium sp.]|uniref:hypothetical protein n=1 Tax=Phenylobacterium sp. TaxID=1871053 RepID=UPI00286C10C6|nr:hypothetical protein [Phenylobacterium sp.]
MSAVACLRILLDARPGTAEAWKLPGLITKVALAFFETRWAWPRRYGEVAPCAFVLADPRASEIDVHKLSMLADDLHTKLFGSNGTGEVVLMSFEGDETQAMRFAAAEESELRSVLSGASSETFGGRICRIKPHEVVVLSSEPAAQAPAAPPADSTEPIRLNENRFSGVYFFPKQAFVGNSLTSRKPGAERFYSPTDAARFQSIDKAFEFDLCALEAAPSVLSQAMLGLLFLPFSFSTIVRPGMREAYQKFLDLLPRDRRSTLAAAVYSVPRDPSLAALAQVKRLLSPTFSNIGLHVNDAGFEIDKLGPEAVSSVTFVLPDGDERARLAGARRFMDQRAQFKAKRIWPAIADISTKREMDTCVELRVPFLTGRAVCEQLVHPMPPREMILGHLPITGSGKHASAFVAA